MSTRENIRLIARAPSSCSALQTSISDEAVATERSHDFKCDKGTINIYIIFYFHTGSYRKDG